ncbi:MAG: transcriptional regulator [Gammaproteobacteria bacterium CG11_big_fil_rev_8_21_14_0_20_46_22]|nr:MAG: transcriptional regulator [Gammaproteobacteria bacterium CG12_big_fil_rev_8_21_14_0_65_46_12]PIR12193.1 MAG: transcriptional regulator [Gammaproteobacteria bacterium CG11_big_fil_rev_8_21_14_0_20_46_22]
MKADRFFYEHPVFRHEEFAAWKASLGEIKPISVNTALRYYVKVGQIKLIRRKLYAVVPPNQSPETLTVDPYLVAGKATEDAVLGYHTALELMGLAYSTFGQFTYVTEQKSKSFGFQERWFQSVAVPTALQKKQKTLAHIDNVDRQGVMLKVTNPARTFVDVLDRIELCGGWEEVCRSLNNFAVLKVDEVVEYCLLLDNARLNATVGYFLSQRQGAFAVRENQLKPLLKAVPKIPQYASKKTREKFQLVKPWNILLPVSVIHQSWEEPHADL